MRLLKLLASKSVIGPIPLLPSRSDFQKASSPMPLGARTPIPVTTIRFRLFMNLGHGNGAFEVLSNPHSRHYIKCSHYVQSFGLTDVIHQIFELFTSCNLCQT